MEFTLKDGHITPSKPFELSQEQFEMNFVSSLPNIEHRARLFEYYKTFVKDFSETITSKFEIWIGGSLLLQKSFHKI